MMGIRQKLKGGAEYDLIYGRKMYCYLNNHNNSRRSIKRGMSRRRRKIAKCEIRNIINLNYVL